MVLRLKPQNHLAHLTRCDSPLILRQNRSNLPTYRGQSGSMSTHAQPPGKCHDTLETFRSCARATYLNLPSPDVFIIVYCCSPMHHMYSSILLPDCLCLPFIFLGPSAYLLLDFRCMPSTAMLGSATRHIWARCSRESFSRRPQHVFTRFA